MSDDWHDKALRLCTKLRAIDPGEEVVELVGVIEALVPEHKRQSAQLAAQRREIEGLELAVAEYLDRMDNDPTEPCDTGQLRGLVDPGDFEDLNLPGARRVRSADVPSVKRNS